jgi:DNA-binding NarL/FixJ family response regulator
VHEVSVLLAVAHALTRDLLARALSESALMRARVTLCDPQEVLVQAGKADVVITDAAEDGLPGPCTHLLAESPHLLVIVVSMKSDRVFAYRQMTSVEELKGSADEIITAICRRLV